MIPVHVARDGERVCSRSVFPCSDGTRYERGVGRTDIGKLVLRLLTGGLMLFQGIYVLCPVAIALLGAGRFSLDHLLLARVSAVEGDR